MSYVSGSAKTNVGFSAVTLVKEDAETSVWRPLEQGRVVVSDAGATDVTISDGAGQVYFRGAVNTASPATFGARGHAGWHRVQILDAQGDVVAQSKFRVQPETHIRCGTESFGDLAQLMQRSMMKFDEHGPWWEINGKMHRMLVCWGRDHVYTLKARKYFLNDVQSGMDYWLDSQEPNGMFWDCIHKNPNYPGHAWFGEALGEGFFRYDDDMKYIVRRIPVEADCEYLYTEGVWHAWKASGDDAWMAKQLPRLELALKYNTSDPTRWSEKRGLVRRSFCMDSWDFANPHFCSGDHRRINPGDAQFLLHSDNAGAYASHWRMAQMYEHLGSEENIQRAKVLREQGEALRKRANDTLFFDTTYGHMIPDELPEDEVYALVGDERKRMSLSLGYTLNRGLPTHEMAVAVIDEYQRRRDEKAHESFAEWWAMDPPYTPEQWPGPEMGGSSPPIGEYMNGGISSIIAGEIARAAFEHGREAYAVDILRRLWELAERDEKHLHEVYTRQPLGATHPEAAFGFVDLRSVVNRGLRHNEVKGVEAWTGEGDNDLRNLPVGKQTFGAITFDVIDPLSNAGEAILRLGAEGGKVPVEVEIPVGNAKAKSLYFLHALAHSAPKCAVVGVYRIDYEDGSSEKFFLKNNREIGSWWGLSEKSHNGQEPVNTETTRMAWQGPNPTWKNVGLYMTGWNNPHPDKAIVRVVAQAIRSSVSGANSGGIMLAGISTSDQPVAFERSIRSYGLPDSWSQGAVYHAIAEGLAGIEDRGRSFSLAKISPRWAAGEDESAEVCLHYPASDGYVAYRYQHDLKKKHICLSMTGSFERLEVHCLLPQGATVKSVQCGGKAHDFAAVKIEGSCYADFELDASFGGDVVVAYTM
ncbi:MAG: hypothetical protein V3V20_04940 [Algisphaera sp.]